MPFPQLTHSAADHSCPEPLQTMAVDGGRWRMHMPVILLVQMMPLDQLRSHSPPARCCDPPPSTASPVLPSAVGGGIS